MRKTLLTLLTVLFTLSSAYAADIVEDWTTRNNFGPTSNSQTGSGTSPTTNITYQFAKAAKMVPTTLTQDPYLTLRTGSGSYIEFSLPINCSEIKIVTSYKSTTSAAVSFSADGNTLETNYPVTVIDKEYTLTIPAQYRTAGTVYRIGRTASVPAFAKFTYVEAVEGGHSLTAAVTDLSFATALNGTQTKTVKGNAEGLTEDISVTVDNEAFTVPATITAEELALGFNVSFTGSAAQNYTGTLTLKSGDLTASVDLKAFAVAHEGTEADPLTPADVIAMNNLNFGPFYIQGTISDKCAESGTDGIAETTELTDYNIILVGADDKKIGVNLQLQDVINVLSILINPKNVGKTVIIKGNLLNYLGTPGVTNTEYVSGLPTTGIADIVADENAPVEYFNLQGIRVANPENGLYIRRQGNKVTKVIVK